MAMTEEEMYQTQSNQAQQQIDNDPNAIHADMLREDRIGNLLEQLNPDKLMSEIEHRIRGEKFDRRKGWIPMTTQKKEISEILISNFMSFLGAILNQNVSMSNFSAAEINNIMEVIIGFVARDLSVNDELYGIEEDYTEMDRIGNIILISCFATFKMAMNGMMSRRVFGSLKVNANLTEEKAPSMAEALKFWG